MWRNCPGRRRKQTRQTTVSTDMDFMENFEPMNRWIDELLQFLMVFHGISSVFSEAYQWYSLGPTEVRPSRTCYWYDTGLLDTAGHCWTLLDTAGHWISWSMEIDGNPETRNILKNILKAGTWAVVSRACQWTVLTFYLIFESSCYAFALACRLLGWPPVWPAWSCFLVWTAYIDTLK